FLAIFNKRLASRLTASNQPKISSTQPQNCRDRDCQGKRRDEKNGSGFGLDGFITSGEQDGHGGAGKAATHQRFPRERTLYLQQVQQDEQHRGLNTNTSK